MSERPDARDRGGMSAAAAFRIEVAIIGLGIVALMMIFQPFALWIFTLGCMLVVCAALLNNLLPFAQPGRPLKKVIFALVIVLLVFCVAIVVSIGAAWLYGLAFLNPPPAGASLVPPRPPFWMSPMIWVLVAAAAALALIVRRMTRGT